ncbi:hypothetical protein E4T66_14205 [Sinimarinibacterium sp. CAU 1509]|uniref:hypothetical protein n=1 Tax=Sinimarinibacterium sp. CAU 1509 TaxID=2562283 RepID=UPI0010AC0A44|nr:hypothetical protein [Sinimarinibacterium sp. CAU 1509]TJY59526.1 hypothetical protein E4T66_14205 [Sinimarinibacterium sp. CAU 1509]
MRLSLLVVAVVALCGSLVYAAGSSQEQLLGAIAHSPPESQQLRRRGWSLIAPVAKLPDTGAVSGWYNEAEIFAREAVADNATRRPFPGRPIGAAAGPGQRLQHIADAPVITFVHYNGDAYEHIRRHRLYRDERLAELARSGRPDPVYAGLREIPPLPSGARVMMSAWWPVAAGGGTPLPVWDPEDVARPGGSNDYTSWRRVVVVDGGDPAEGARAVTFAGRYFATARGISLERFVRLPVDRGLAEDLMEDSGARKAAFLALARPLQAGDVLVLVAFHLMAPDAGAGTWTTAWWHDRPDDGVFGADRPLVVSGAWRNYLMDVAVDPVRPLGRDASPHICFNPWFEAKFPDGGQGNGLQSNCVNCHERASYPLTAFLPVRRGAADPVNDPAFAPGRLRTGRLWSLANPPAELR